MAINKISQEKINQIKQKSVITLPNQPKISAEELKARFVKPITDTTNSTIAEINRIVDEVNNDIETANNLLLDHDADELAHADIRGLITGLDNTKVDKVPGKSLISDAEITRLANVDNYDDTEIRGLITTIQNIITSIDGEEDGDSVINKLHEVVVLLNGYAEGTTLVDLLSGKVDKVDGKGLSTNDYTTAEKEKLSGIEPNANNYDDTEVRGLITGLDNTKVDKVSGKSLISDTEISRLASVDNYDDTEVRGLITALDADKADVIHTHSNYTTEDAVQTKINTHNSSETSHTDIRNSVAEAKAIAEGKVSAMSFETKEDLDAWLLIPENVETLIVGTNFYIEDLASPDYWWNGTTLVELSTDKIDLTDYAKSDDLATVATTGSYNDLTNTPTIPTIPNISLNDNQATAGKYISKIEVDATDKHKLIVTKADLPQGFSGNYEDLIGAPTIPSKTSDLENDSNFATKTYVDNKVSSVYKVKGTVANYSSLPSENNVIGDVWNLTDTGANYVWDGSAWDKLGDTVDLSAYAKTEDLPTISTNITTDATSDTKTTSPKAVKTYVDNAINSAILGLLGGES